MGQRLLDSQPVLRVEDEHFLEEVQGLIIHVGEERREGPFLDEGDLVQALLRHD